MLVTGSVVTVGEAAPLLGEPGRAEPMRVDVLRRCSSFEAVVLGLTAAGDARRSPTSIDRGGARVGLGLAAAALVIAGLLRPPLGSAGPVTCSRWRPSGSASSCPSMFLLGALFAAPVGHRALVARSRAEVDHAQQRPAADVRATLG